MPDRPPHACPDCGIATRTRRCKACESRRQRSIDARRGSSSARGYDVDWQRIRADVLDEELLCRFCAQRGRVTVATDVDHIDGNVANCARGNLRPLCHACHSRRTMRDQVPRRGRPARMVRHARV